MRVVWHSGSDTFRRYALTACGINLSKEKEDISVDWWMRRRLKEATRKKYWGPLVLQQSW
jgi:hypothetical protein